jgi:hypothetical protein
MKVQPLPSGVGRDQDAQRVIGGRGVERLFDAFAAIGGG